MGLNKTPISLSGFLFEKFRNAEQIAYLKDDLPSPAKNFWE